MAKQASVQKLTGSMGGVSYYKDNGEYRAREKGGPNPETVRTSPRFARTRENAKEFRRAVRAGMLVRRCLKNLTKGMKLADNRISARLNAMLTQVVKSDPVSDRGERIVSKGQVDMLEDFAFRKDKAFGSVFMAGPTSTIDTANGRMKVEIRPFDPQLRINGPEAATHFKIMTNAAAIDFEKERHSWDYKETAYLSLGEYIEQPITLEHAPEVKPGQTLLLAIGVAFYVRGEDGRLEQADGGVMRILQVSEPRFCGIEGIGEKDELQTYDTSTQPHVAELHTSDRFKVQPEVIADVFPIAIGDRFPASADEVDDTMVTALQTETFYNNT